MESQPQTEPASDPAFPLKLLLRLGIPVVVIAVIILLAMRPIGSPTVSEVVDEIYKVALQEPEGGPMASWWIAAGGFDATAGRLNNLRVETSSLHIAAESGRVVVDPQDDTFRFEMWNVVIARIDEPPEGEQATRTVVHADHYILGPIPYRKDIVADKGVTRLTTVP